MTDHTTALTDHTTSLTDRVTSPLVDHVGVLVTDIVEAVEHWTQVLGYTFSPVMSYRTDAYVDSSDTEPHFHDAKIAFSTQGPPFIELMEFTGEGTHSPAQGEGFHHLGFRVADAPGRCAALESLGVHMNGASLGPDGAAILWFTEPRDLNNMRLEYVGPEQQPVYGADGAIVVYEAPGSGATS